MSKLIVYSASAGSGKTYRLALEYIKQLLENPQNYKHILAVTFTNKATNEMKGRILKELSLLAMGKQTSIYQEILNETNISEKSIPAKANEALKLILHNYSQFSISTIDSFVQRVIQALLWEIDEQGSINIELDTAPVIEQAADNLLDSAAHDIELMEWISGMAYSLLDDGKNWDIRSELLKLGNQLYSEKFRLMSKAEIENLTKRENINAFREKLTAFSSSFINRLRNHAESALKQLHEQELSIDDFSNKEKGVMGFFIRCAELKANASELPNIGVRVSAALESPTGEEWVTKTVANNQLLFNPIQHAVTQYLHPTLLRMIQLIQQEGPTFNSAQLVLRNLGNLALIADLWNKIKELSQQEGFMLLSDSGHLLREFIHDSDAPFVYEKVGTRYDVFMIDEFQDTSEVQWHNFKPLINNSLSQGHFSMIVGDVKQSIYRWRNGNWSILANEVDNDFRHQGVHRIPLTNNWRSLPQVVEFNNQFFKHAKEISAAHIYSIFEESMGEMAMEYQKQIERAYADIEQTSKVGGPNDPGFVELNILNTTENPEIDAIIAADLVAKIQGLRKLYPLNEIGILVRKKSEGQRIANMLLEHNRNEPRSENHIPFVSQDGLLLKSSNVVGLIISALALINDRQNRIEKRVFAKQLAALSQNEEAHWHTIFGEDFVANEVEWLSTLSIRPLQEIFEAIVDRFNLKNFKGELAYLAELHEHIVTFSSRGSGNINRFLDWWNDKKQNLALSVPSTPNALSIITIHKSKGLEYPIVFVPFAQWDFRERGKTPTLWVSSSEPPLDMLSKYPIPSTKNALNSLFAPFASEETMKELVDSLNLLYVAFTRAQRELYVYLPKEKEEKSNEPKLSAITQIIHRVIGMMDLDTNPSREDERITRYSKGKQGIAPPAVESEKFEKSWIIGDYPVGQSHSSINLQMESDSFFSSEAAPSLQPLIHGKVMHQIFSLIKTADQVEQAVQQAKVEGLISQTQQQEITEFIKSRIQQSPYTEWFSGNWTVKNEQSILTPQGHTYRPDRVMVQGDETVIVDFKFGAEAPQYAKQVGRYKTLLSQMGHQNIQAFLWYVDANRLVEV